MSSPPSKIQVQNIGDSVRLICSARGLPLPKVKWLKNGDIISMAAQEENDLIKSEFVIVRFKPSDAGIYTCLFENEQNGTAEANTTLSMSVVHFVLFLDVKENRPFFPIRSVRNSYFTMLFFRYSKMFLESQR